VLRKSSNAHLSSFLEFLFSMCTSDSKLRRPEVGHSSISKWEKGHRARQQIASVHQNFSFNSSVAAIRFSGSSARTFEKR
jgi:hypothetical protein